MGYDLSRFISEIEEEFLCSICTMVLEDPLQSFCEHMYCQRCIKDWLMRDERCPDDRTSLTFDQLKVPGRIIRNLLNKLVIKCDFYRQGCKKVVTIEHIQDHRDRCEFKPTVPMVCDTGYNNIHVQSNNTFVNEPTKMEKCDVKANHISRQQSPSQLEDVMHKVSGEQFETEILESNQTSVNQPKWQQLCNLKINTDDILEVETESFYAFAQSACAMDPTTTESSFKIQLLTFDYFKYMAIGFTCKGHQTDKIPGLDDESIGCDSSGDLIMDKKSKKVGEQWKAGDVIECGIKFPCNLSNNGERDDVDDVQVKIYFCRNGQLIADTKMLMPKNGYFPTIYMFEGVMGGWWNNGEMCDVTGTNTKVKYFN